MLIITNRNINEDNFEDGIGNHKAFGDGINAKEPNEVRLAHAVKKDGKMSMVLKRLPFLGHQTQGALRPRNIKLLSVQLKPQQGHWMQPWKNSPPT